MEQGFAALFTKPSFVFDIICIAALLVLAARYGRKGLAATVVGLAGTAASLLGAKLFSDRASPWVFENLMARTFRERIAETLSESGSVDLAALADQFAGFLPESFRRSVVDSFTATVTGAVESSTAQLAERIVTDVVQPLMTPVISIVLYFVAFAVLRMAVSLLVTVLTNVNRIPVVGGVNRALGFAVGLVAAAIDLFLALCVVWALIVVTGGSLPYLNESALAASWFYRLFTRVNPFI